MLKLMILICVLLCGLALSKDPILESANISVMKSLHSRNLFMIKINTHLFSLTWKNKTHLEVFSTNQTDGVNSLAIAEEKCSFDTRENPFKDLNSSRILNTVVLGDNRTVAALGFRQQSIDLNDPFNRHDYYDVFLFDLTNCNYKIIEIAHLNKVPVLNSEYQPRLIGHDDTFDVFFFDNQECSPCRYNSEGKLIEVKHKIKINFDEEFSSFHIKLLDPIDTERNYFYAYNFQNGTAMMKLLDENFDVVKQRHVDYEIVSFSINKDVGAPIGICYFLNNEQNYMYCERLDFYLNSVLEPFKLSVPLGNIITNATVTLDTLGNTFVGVLHAPLYSKQSQLAVFRYDLHGRLVESLNLGHVGNDSSTSGIVQIDSFIVEGMQNQYCVVAYEIKDGTSDHHDTHIKCFQAPKDDETME